MFFAPLAYFRIYLPITGRRAIIGEIMKRLR
jgi:hypothetical protein